MASCSKSSWQCHLLTDLLTCDAQEEELPVVGADILQLESTIEKML